MKAFQKNSIVLFCLCVFVFIVLTVFGFFPETSASSEVPELQRHQFVYTLPKDFNAPFIGAEGMRFINQTAQTLHYPYFVVLSEQLPGATDEDASELIHTLSETWAERYPELYDPKHSQIFLLTYTPRKYRFLAGLTFQKQLGFEGEAHRPFTRKFLASARQQPRDPQKGIVDMMLAVDDYLFTSMAAAEKPSGDPSVLGQRLRLYERRLFLQKIAAGFAFFLLFLLFLRWRSLRALRHKFAEKMTEWRAGFAQASQRYTSFETASERLTVRLRQKVGLTQTTHQDMVSELACVALWLKDFEAHLEHCSALAQGASLRNFSPLKAAIRCLETTLCLHHNPHQALSLTAFKNFLDKSFTQIENDQARLNMALEKQVLSPRTLFPQDLKKQLLVYTKDLLKAAHRHPLLSRNLEPLYQELDIVRRQDPLLYLERIDALHTTHEHIRQQLEQTQTLLSRLASACFHQPLPDFHVSLPPAFDPQPVHQKLQNQEKALQETLSQGASFELLISMLQDLLAQDRGLQDLLAYIPKALAELPLVQAEYEKKAAQCKAFFYEVQSKARACKPFHLGTKIEVLEHKVLKASRTTGVHYLNALKAARAGDRLTAYAGFLEAIALCQQEMDCLEDLNALCDQLQSQKMRYENRLKELQELQVKYTHQLRMYRSTTRLEPIPLYSLTEPQHYAALERELTELTSLWDAKMAAAEAAHAEVIGITSEGGLSLGSFDGGSSMGGGDASSGGNW